MGTSSSCHWSRLQRGCNTDWNRDGAPTTVFVENASCSWYSSRWHLILHQLVEKEVQRRDPTFPEPKCVLIGARIAAAFPTHSLDPLVTTRRHLLHNLRLARRDQHMRSSSTSAQCEPIAAELTSRPLVRRCSFIVNHTDVSAPDPHLMFCPLSPRESENPFLVKQTVQARITLSLLADEARNRERVILACVPAVLVCDAHIELHRAMLFCWDEFIRRRALSWDVQIHELALVVLHG